MGENRIMCDLCEENQRLKARIKELEDKHWAECRQIAHYSDENKRIKEQIEQLIKAYEKC